MTFVFSAILFLLGYSLYTVEKPQGAVIKGIAYSYVRSLNGRTLKKWYQEKLSVKLNSIGTQAI